MQRKTKSWFQKPNDRNKEQGTRHGDERGKGIKGSPPEREMKRDPVKRRVQLRIRSSM